MRNIKFLIILIFLLAASIYPYCDGVSQTILNKTPHTLTLETDFDGSYVGMSYMILIYNKGDYVGSDTTLSSAPYQFSIDASPDTLEIKELQSSTEYITQLLIYSGSDLICKSRAYSHHTKGKKKPIFLKADSQLTYQHLWVGHGIFPFDSGDTYPPRRASYDPLDTIDNLGTCIEPWDTLYTKNIVIGDTCGDTTGSIEVPMYYRFCNDTITYMANDTPLIPIQDTIWKVVLRGNIYNWKWYVDTMDCDWCSSNYEGLRMNSDFLPTWAENVYDDYLGEVPKCFYGGLLEIRFIDTLFRVNKCDTGECWSDWNRYNGGALWKYINIPLYITRWVDSDCDTNTIEEGWKDLLVPKCFDWEAFALYGDFTDSVFHWFICQDETTFLVPGDTVPECPTSDSCFEYVECNGDTTQFCSGDEFDPMSCEFDSLYYDTSIDSLYAGFNDTMLQTYIPRTDIDSAWIDYDTLYIQEDTLIDTTLLPTIDSIWRSCDSLFIQDKRFKDTVTLTINESLWVSNDTLYVIEGCDTLDVFLEIKSCCNLFVNGDAEQGWIGWDGGFDSADEGPIDERTDGTHYFKNIWIGQEIPLTDIAGDQICISLNYSASASGCDELIIALADTTSATGAGADAIPILDSTSFSVNSGWNTYTYCFEEIDTLGVDTVFVATWGVGCESSEKSHWDSLMATTNSSCEFTDENCYGYEPTLKESLFIICPTDSYWISAGDTLPDCADTTWWRYICDGTIVIDTIAPGDTFRYPDSCFSYADNDWDSAGTGQMIASHINDSVGIGTNWGSLNAKFTVQGSWSADTNNILYDNTSINLGIASRIDATMGGILSGSDHHVEAVSSVIAGGFTNTIYGNIGFIGAGGDNRIGQEAYYSTIGGGSHNRIARGWHSVIGGGQGNHIWDKGCVIAGGEYDTLFGTYLFATNRKSYLDTTCNNSAVFNGRYITADTLNDPPGYGWSGDNTVFVDTINAKWGDIKNITGWSPLKIQYATHDTGTYEAKWNWDEDSIITVNTEWDSCWWDTTATDTTFKCSTFTTLIDYYIADSSGDNKCWLNTNADTADIGRYICLNTCPDTTGYVAEYDSVSGAYLIDSSWTCNSYDSSAIQIQDTIAFKSGYGSMDGFYHNDSTYFELPPKTKIDNAGDVGLLVGANLDTALNVKSFALFSGPMSTNNIDAYGSLNMNNNDINNVNTISTDTSDAKTGIFTELNYPYLCDSVSTCTTLTNWDTLSSFISDTIVGLNSIETDAVCSLDFQNVAMNITTGDIYGGDVTIDFQSGDLSANGFNYPNLCDSVVNCTTETNWDTLSSIYAPDSCGAAYFDTIKGCSSVDFPTGLISHNVDDDSFSVGSVYMHYASKFITISDDTLAIGTSRMTPGKTYLWAEDTLGLMSNGGTVILEHPIKNVNLYVNGMIQADSLHTGLDGITTSGDLSANGFNYPNLCDSIDVCDSLTFNYLDMNCGVIDSVDSVKGCSDVYIEGGLFPSVDTFEYVNVTDTFTADTVFYCDTLKNVVDISYAKNGLKIAATGTESSAFSFYLIDALSDTQFVTNTIFNSSLPTYWLNNEITYSSSLNDFGDLIIEAYIDYTAPDTVFLDSTYLYIKTIKKYR